MSKKSDLLIINRFRTYKVGIFQITFTCWIAILLIAQINGKLFAQHNEIPNYTSYFLKCGSAHKYYSQNEYAKACETYLSAFSNVPYIHQKYFERAEKTAQKSNHTELKSYLALNKDKTFDTKQINKDYQSRINTLIKMDQAVRSNQYVNAQDYIIDCKKSNDCDTTSKKYRQALAYRHKWYMTDSTVISDLLNLIQNYGFPAERLVGAHEYHYASIILLHYDMDQDNKVLQPILDDALSKGDMLPADYASIVDRRLSMYGKKVKYFQVPFGYDNLSQQEKDDVDKERQLIGLPAIKDSRLIVRKKNKIVVHPLD
jgi:hypothetical protein